MAKFELQPGEEVLRKASVSWVKSKVNLIVGTMYLTNQRIVFLPGASMAFALFGLLGGALGAILGKKSLDKNKLEATPEQVEAYWQGKHGINKKILVLQLPNEERKFVLNKKYETWAPDLHKLLGQEKEQPARE